MPDRSVAPPALPIDLPHLPEFEAVNIKDALGINILKQGQQPVVLFEMIIPVGRFEEPSPGISYYLFKMLTEGTLRRTSEEIASTFDYYGSHLEITPTLDHVSIKLYTLSKFFPQLLSLLAEMLTEPAFLEKEFATLKAIRTQNIKQQNARNNVFASLKFRELLFGADHPYGRISTVEQAMSPSRADLLDFQPSLLAKPSIFMTGLITDTEVQAVYDCLSRIPFSDKLTPGDVEVDRSDSIKIDREGSTQASVRIGNQMINRHHPDIHKLGVTNELLGGFFGSRLMKNIREEKGLTYGIHSSILHLEKASYWSIGSEMLSDKLSLGIGEIYKEIKKLQSEPPRQVEFDTVINYMKGQFLGSFDSPFSAHNKMRDIILQGLTNQYFIDFFNTLQAITPDEVSDTASRYFTTDNLLELVVS